MNKNILLSLVAVAVLFTGCDDDTKKTVSETTTEVKEKTVEAVDATKQVAEDAVEAVKEKTAEVVETVKAKVASATSSDGQKLYVKCQGCHGLDGSAKALGKSAPISGQSVADLVTSLNAYKSNTKNVTGMGGLMTGQVATMSDADIQAVSEYIAGL